MLKSLLLTSGLLMASSAMAGPLCDATMGHAWCVHRQQEVLREGLGDGLSNAGRALQGIDGGPSLQQQPRMNCHISRFHRDAFNRPTLDCD